MRPSVPSRTRSSSSTSAQVEQGRHARRSPPPATTPAVAANAATDYAARLRHAAPGAAEDLLPRRRQPRPGPGRHLRQGHREPRQHAWAERCRGRGRAGHPRHATGAACSPRPPPSPKRRSGRPAWSRSWVWPRSPTVPDSPTPLRDAGIAAAVALVLGIGLAFLLEQLDNKVKTPEQVLQVTGGVPVLGSVPAYSDGHRHLTHRFHRAERALVAADLGGGRVLPRAGHQPALLQPGQGEAHHPHHQLGGRGGQDHGHGQPGRRAGRERLPGRGGVGRPAPSDAGRAAPLGRDREGPHLGHPGRSRTGVVLRLGPAAERQEHLRAARRAAAPRAGGAARVRRLRPRARPDQALAGRLHPGRLRPGAAGQRSRWRPHVTSTA